jgi:hypothetical protein
MSRSAVGPPGKEKPGPHPGAGLSQKLEDATPTNSHRVYRQSAVSAHIPSLPDDVDNLTAALEYGKPGLYLLPVEPETKNPGSRVGKDWQHKSSRDPDVLTAWLAGTSDGIAIDLGRSGLVGIDVDKPELMPQWLQTALTESGAPFQSTRPDTPGRGHYIFRQPDGRRIGCSTGKLAGIGLDVKGCGGVIIVAPTMHPDGGEYRWQNTGEIPVLPDEIADKTTDARDRESAATDSEVRKFLDTHTDASISSQMNGWISKWKTAIAQHDSRHKTMVAIMPWAMEEARCGYVSARGASEVLRSLFITAKTRREYNGTAPMTEARANAAFDGILAWGIGQAMQHPIAELRERRRNGAQQETSAPVGDVLAGMRNGNWLDAQQFPPLHYHVPYIVPEGLGFLVGPPKSLKSWMVAGIALGCAAGSKVLGSLEVTQRPVLYLALEDGDRRLQDRFRRILDNAPIPEHVNYITQAQPGDVIPIITAFLERHPDSRPLISIDTFGKIKPPKRPGQESYQADYEIVSALKNAIETRSGASFLIVHHTRKMEATDFIDVLSGTQGLAGAADFVLVLKRKRLADDAILAVTGRDIPEREYALRLEDQVLWRLDGYDLDTAAAAAESRRQQAADANLGDISQMVSTFVNSRSVTELDDVMAKFGPDPETTDLTGIAKRRKAFAQTLRRLAEADRIVKLGPGIYRPAIQDEACEDDEVDADQTQKIKLHGFTLKNNQEEHLPASTSKLHELHQPRADTHPMASDDIARIDGQQSVDRATQQTCAGCEQQLLAPHSIERGFCERCRRDQLATSEHGADR